MSKNTKAYNMGAIRELLLAAFTAEELHRFCQDRPVLCPIVTKFGPGHGLDDMVDEVIEYCRLQLLFDNLLTGVKEANPRQYARFEPEILSPEPEPVLPIDKARSQTLALPVPWIWIAAGLLLLLVAGWGVGQLLSCGATPPPDPSRITDRGITYTPEPAEPSATDSLIDDIESPTPGQTPETPTPTTTPETPKTSETPGTTVSDGAPEDPTPTPMPEPPTPTATPVPACPMAAAGLFASLWERYQDQLGCPLFSEPRVIDDAEQAFERGHMFWRQDNDRVYAVYEGGPKAGSYEWFAGWNGSDYDCPSSPPEGKFLPTRGFGWVWCTRLQDPTLTLGWGLAGEVGFGPGYGDPLVQEFERGFVFRDSAGSTNLLAYIFLADGSVLRERY